MIKKIAVTLSLLALSGIAQAVVINFDELADGTVVNNVYAGVTFGTLAGDGEVRVFSACCSESDPNSIAPHPGDSSTATGSQSLGPSPSPTDE